MEKEKVFQTAIKYSTYHAPNDVESNNERIQDMCQIFSIFVTDKMESLLEILPRRYRKKMYKCCVTYAISTDMLKLIFSRKTFQVKNFMKIDRKFTKKDLTTS